MSALENHHTESDVAKFQQGRVKPQVWVWPGTSSRADRFGNGDSTSGLRYFWGGQSRYLLNRQESLRALAKDIGEQIEG
jgi:hypothetical protein